MTTISTSIVMNIELSRFVIFWAQEFFYFVFAVIVLCQNISTALSSFSWLVGWLIVSGNGRHPPIDSSHTARLLRCSDAQLVQQSARWYSWVLSSSILHPVICDLHLCIIQLISSHLWTSLVRWSNSQSWSCALNLILILPYNTLYIIQLANQYLHIQKVTWRGSWLFNISKPNIFQCHQKL